MPAILPLSQTRTAIQAATRLEPAKGKSKATIEHERFAAELKARRDEKQALATRLQKQDQVRLSALAIQRSHYHDLYQEDAGPQEPACPQIQHCRDMHDLEASQLAEELVGNA